MVRTKIVAATSITLLAIGGGVFFSTPNATLVAEPGNKSFTSQTDTTTTPLPEATVKPEDTSNPVPLQTHLMGETATPDSRVMRARMAERKQYVPQAVQTQPNNQRNTTLDPEILKRLTAANDPTTPAQVTPALQDREDEVRDNGTTPSQPPSPAPVKPVEPPRAPTSPTPTPTNPTPVSEEISVTRFGLVPPTTTGTVTITKTGSAYKLSLKEFNTVSVNTPRLLLSKQLGGQNCSLVCLPLRTLLDSGDYLDLGELQANSGDQTFTLPAAYVKGGYVSVLVHDPILNLNLGIAPLQLR